MSANTELRIKEYGQKFSQHPRLLTGNLQIIACAGAGKTDFISWRTAFLIANNLAKPENIVAFTFTERAAEELKFRIRHHMRALLGKQPDMGDMYVGTIHSYCFKLLQEFVPKYKVYDVLDEGSRYAYLSSLRNELDYKHLQNSLLKHSKKAYGMTTQSWVLNTFIKNVDMVREEMVDVKKVSASNAFNQAYEVYDSSMDERRFLDFSSMMSQAVNYLEKYKEVRRKVKEKYTHITVDEYQDVNPIQEKLINLLAGKNGNLCVVGDDDQSIYQWRGSTVDNIIHFKKRYKDVYTYKLPTNYRSTNYIVESANAVMSKNKKRLPKSMKAGGGDGEHGDIYKVKFDHQDEEVRFIVDKIKDLIGTEYIEKDGSIRGLTYSDIAIFFRSVKYDAEPYINALKEADLPVAVSGVGGLFDPYEADVIFSIFSYLGEFGKIWDWQNRVAFVPEIEDIYKDAKSSFMIDTKKNFISYFTKLKNTVKASRRVSLQGLYGDILYGLGVQKEEFHDDKNEIILYNLGRISQAISDYESTRTYTTYRDIEGFCWFITHYALSNYDEGSGDDATLALNGVQIMTLHGTKGLGFPVVFMPYSVEKNPRDADTGFLNPKKFNFERYKGSETDERRLFYVGMTRAKKFLYITYPERLKKQAYREPIRFYKDIPNKYCVTEPIPDPAKRKKTTPKPAEDAIRFPTTFSELSYYLSCSYDYKMRFIYGFNPELVQALGYGNQVHNIINMLHKLAQDTGNLPTMKDAEKLIEKNFYLRYAARQQTETLKKSALRSIAKYLKMWKDDFTLSVKTERPFEIDIEDALVSGAIDLLKRSSYKEDGVLEIVDFKTGKNRAFGEEMDLQVQLYTYAAREALGLNVEKAYLHFLDDEKAERREILITENQLDMAVRSIKFSIKGVSSRNFQRDPRNKKVCNGCDWKVICPQKKT